MVSAPLGQHSPPVLSLTPPHVETAVLMAGINPWHQCWTGTRASQRNPLPCSSQAQRAPVHLLQPGDPRLPQDHHRAPEHPLPRVLLQGKPQGLCCSQWQGWEQGSSCKPHPQAFRGIYMGCAKSLPHPGTETVRQSQVSPEGLNVLEQIRRILYYWQHLQNTLMSLPHCPWGRRAALWSLCYCGGG